MSDSEIYKDNLEQHEFGSTSIGDCAVTWHSPTHVWLPEQRELWLRLLLRTYVNQGLQHMLPSKWNKKSSGFQRWHAICRIKYHSAVLTYQVPLSSFNFPFKPNSTKFCITELCFWTELKLLFIYTIWIYIKSFEILSVRFCMKTS